MEDTNKNGTLILSGDCALYIASHMPVDLQYRRMVRFIDKVTAPFTSGNILLERKGPTKIARIYTELFQKKNGNHGSTAIAALEQDYANGLFTHVLIDLPLAKDNPPNPHPIIQRLKQKGIPHINLQEEDIRDATAEQTGRPYIQYTDALTYAADAVAYMPALCHEILRFLRRQYHILYQISSGDKESHSHYAHYSETLRQLDEDMERREAQGHGQCPYVETTLHKYYSDRKYSERMYATAPDEYLLLDEPRLTQDIAAKQFTPNDKLEALHIMEHFCKLGFHPRMANGNAYELTREYTVNGTSYKAYLDPREQGYITFTVTENDLIRIRFKVHSDWKWTIQDIDTLMTLVIEKAITQDEPTDQQLKSRAGEIARFLNQSDIHKTYKESKPKRKSKYDEDEPKRPGYFAIQNIYSLESIYDALYKALEKGVHRIARLQHYQIDETALHNAIREELEDEKKDATWGSSPYSIKKYQHDPIPVIEVSRFDQELADRMQSITSILRPYGLKPDIQTFTPPDVHNISPSTEQDTAYAICVSPYRNIVRDAHRRAKERNDPFSMYTEPEPSADTYASCSIRLRLSTGKQPLQEAMVIPPIRKILDGIENTNFNKAHIEIGQVLLEDRDNNGQPIK